MCCLDHSGAEFTLLRSDVPSYLLCSETMLQPKSGSLGRMALGFLSILYFLRGRLRVGVLPRHADDDAGPLVHAGNGAKERAESMGQLWPTVGCGGADKSDHTLDPSISVRMALFPERCTAAMALGICNGSFVSGPNGCAMVFAQLHGI